MDMSAEPISNKNKYHPAYAESDAESECGSVISDDPFIAGDIVAKPSNDMDAVYKAKAEILNDAIQEIGMGRYQWDLFFVAGFGWLADNLWPQVTAIILPSVLYEWKPKQDTYLTLAQNIGLAMGACVWGMGSDIIGRRWAFNLTLLITATFGLMAGTSRNFSTIAAYAAVWSVGVGGNLPVDSAVFLEFIPGSHQYLLTIMSVWWSLGQLLASAVAWPIMARFACVTPDDCSKEGNMGWRYFIFIMGGLTALMFLIRVCTFPLYESPKFLMGRGRDAEAVRIIHKLAKYNRKVITLSIEDLHAVEAERSLRIEVEEEDYTTVKAVIKRRFRIFGFDHIRALFETKELAFSTGLVVTLWAIVGLAFPLYNAFLPYFLQSRGAKAGDSSPDIIFRNYLVIAVCGIPGSLLGAFFIELPRLGRKGVMAVATFATGIFLLTSTTARTSNQLLGWNCAYAASSNAMYAVMYSYTPEIFLTKHRGTGNGLAASANRFAGVVAPVIAGMVGLETSVLVWVAGALFLLAGAMMLLLPYESRGRASL